MRAIRFANMDKCYGIMTTITIKATNRWRRSRKREHRKKLVPMWMNTSPDIAKNIMWSGRVLVADFILLQANYLRHISFVNYSKQKWINLVLAIWGNFWINNFFCLLEVSIRFILSPCKFWTLTHPVCSAIRKFSIIFSPFTSIRRVDQLPSLRKQTVNATVDNQ